MKNNITVSFFDLNENKPLAFVVISVLHSGKWVYVRHNQRNTYEIPGGHIDAGEDALTAAKRELYEETGAKEFEMLPVCIYGVNRGEEVSYGQVFFANVTEFGDLPSEYEMSERIFMEGIPENLTYPLIQTYIFEYTNNWLSENKIL